MTRTRLIAAALLSLTACAAAQDKKPDLRDYDSLTDRNMFLRERHAPQPPRVYTPRPRVDTTSPQAREKQFVLRGVAIEDNNELHAYLENARTGEVLRVAPGDPLLAGHVTDIAIDAICYAADGKTAWIEVGQNLAGVRSADMPPDENAGTQPSDTAAAGRPSLPPGGPLPPGASLEERMKARRAAQRGGK